MSRLTVKIQPSVLLHPGPWLKAEVVMPTGMAIPDLAAHLGIRPKVLSELLEGTIDFTAEVAIRFEKAFGLKADTLLQMQSAYRLSLARRHSDSIKVAPLRSVLPREGKK